MENRYPSIATMYSDTLSPRHHSYPCCSTTDILDTMCDTNYHFECVQQHIAPEAYTRQVGNEMDSLMQTLQNNPNFYEPTVFYVPPSPFQFAHKNDINLHESQKPFENSYYQPSPDIQTPHASPEPIPGAVQGQFEEYSLATQLPALNNYNVSYSAAEQTPNSMSSTEFQDFEPYTAQYFFTTPPDTPPSVSVVPPPALVDFCSSPAYLSKNCDPTPTIRKLLQQKKKRMPAVPCHANSVCTTCKTRTTSLWRRNQLGEIECNACNLYFRKNNCKRPVTLRKDEIMKRKRKPRIDAVHPAQVKSASVDFHQIEPEQKVLSFS